MASSSYGTRLGAFMNSIEDLEKSGKKYSTLFFLSTTVGLNMATSPLQHKANDVRANRVNWQSYLQGQMISQEDYGIITKLDATSADVRGAILKENPNQCAKMFLTMMAHMAKDQTLQYVLTMIDDILQEDKTRVEIFREYAKKNKESVWAPFLAMLNRTDTFIINQTSRVIAKIACWGNELMDGSDLTFYLTWLRDQLRLPNNEHVQTVARCLQMMLRIGEYRHTFVNVDGINAIIQVLQSSKNGFQIQYQLTFCLWILTFDPVLADRLSKCSLIPVLADILSEAGKEKVTRIVLATLRNLLEKPTERELINNNILAMVQFKVLKQLTLLEGRKFDDPDLIDDIQYLNETLQASVQDLSSFDEYSQEIRSGRLEWSPVHKSEKFWRENAARLCEKNCELLKILIRLLETSKDPLILSVAVYDMGEFVRHYPRGKTLIESLGGKTLIMTMLSHDDPNVKYQSLIAVQKIMVHNWEYLGKQLGSTATPAPAAKDGAAPTAAKA